MEPYTKNLSDTTYMSELIPLFWLAGIIEFFVKRAGLIRAITYSHFVSVSYALIK